MDLARDYVPDARGLSLAQFRERHGDLFLLKKGADGAWEQDIEYSTAVGGIDDADFGLEDPDGFRASWRVAAVKKRGQNPFPDRISVGRARNCDVVIRLAHVSKLHAHFLSGDKGELRLGDARSVNGTFHLGRRLANGETVGVSVGDTIRFGSVEVTLVDARSLHRLLLDHD